MNSEYRHRTVIYVIIGIIIVVILGVYIYSVLSARQPVQTPQVGMSQASSSSLIILTPEESQQKAAIIQSVITQTAVPLSKAQIAAKAALLKKAETGGGAK